MFVAETCSEVLEGKNFEMNFLFKIVWNIWPLLLKLHLE
jgi:hypothetical protein